MRCPFCGTEMEKGLIQSTHTIFWKPGESRMKPAIFSSQSKMLSNGVGLSLASVVAYACKHCEKIVIDYTNDRQDLNLRR